MEDGKKKSIAALIVGGLPKKESSFTSEVSGEDDDLYDADMEEGLNQASEEALAAFESKDPVALTSALKSFIEMCK
jgi:hypothetical protein